MTQRDFKTEKELIKKFKIPKVVFADLLGISGGSFQEKLNETRYQKFTEEQKDKITKYLLSMGEALVKSFGKKTK